MSNDGPMRKLELRGATAVLSENATGYLMKAQRAGCTPEGHAAAMEAVATIGRQIELTNGYLTNGSATDNAEAAHAKIMPDVEKRLSEMEVRIVAACQTSKGDQTGAAFKVGKKSVSNEAYKKTVVGALASLIVAVTAAIPSVVSSCNKANDAAALALRERSARMAEFAAAQSNNVEAVRALAMAVSRMDKEHAAAQGVKP